jgi:uncharacterized protein with NAD-binding domain and iron-sulfur cluster
MIREDVISTTQKNSPAPVEEISIAVKNENTLTTVDLLTNAQSSSNSAEGAIYVSQTQAGLQESFSTTSTIDALHVTIMTQYCLHITAPGRIETQSQQSTSRPNALTTGSILNNDTIANTVASASISETLASQTTTATAELSKLTTQTSTSTFNMTTSTTPIPEVFSIRLGNISSQAIFVSSLVSILAQSTTTPLR